MQRKHRPSCPAALGNPVRVQPDPSKVGRHRTARARPGPRELQRIGQRVAEHPSAERGAVSEPGCAGGLEQVVGHLMGTQPGVIRAIWCSGSALYLNPR